MIYEGKLLYFTQMLLPEAPDSLIMGYNKEEIGFCENNESEMWTYLIEHKLLFNTDYFTIRKFTSDGPFTKAFTNQSPARAVNWLGWQIVKEYQKRNKKTTLKQLMEMNDYQNLLKESRYSPD